MPSAVMHTIDILEEISDEQFDAVVHAEYKARRYTVERVQRLVDQFADLEISEKSDEAKEGAGQKSERPEGSEEGEIEG